MRISYKGRDKGCKYRVAEITYDANKESDFICRLVDWLDRVRGWKVDCCVTEDIGCAMVVVENMDEYKEFKEDYLIGKKMFRNCEKLGF